MKNIDWSGIVCCFAMVVLSLMFALLFLTFGIAIFNTPQ